MSFKNSKESYATAIIKQLMGVINGLYDLLRQKEQIVQPKYKLVDWIIRADSGEGYCRIQIIGTGRVADYKPEEIVADDNFITDFHQEDVRTITNLANLEKYKPKLKLHGVNYDYNEKRVIIKLRDGKQKSYAVEEIKGDPTVLEEFSKRDIFNIGRIVGDEDNSIS